jgi:hypothetical protein
VVVGGLVVVVADPGSVTSWTRVPSWPAKFGVAVKLIRESCR